VEMMMMMKDMIYVKYVSVIKLNINILNAILPKKIFNGKIILKIIEKLI